MTHLVALGARTDADDEGAVDGEQALVAVQQLLLADAGDQVANVVLGVTSDSVQIVAVLLRGLGSGLL